MIGYHYDNFGGSFMVLQWELYCVNAIAVNLWWFI